MNIFELVGTIAINNRAANESLKDTTQKAERTGKKIREAFKSIGSATLKAGKVVVGAATAAGTAWAATVESTRDYRTDMAKLDTAFTSNGHSAENAMATYKALQAALGESDQAVEAANHLSVMCKSEEQLSKWTDICVGVFSQFGDSLPIEGLTEAANETVKVGQVTGPLADALNWVGISEENMNKKLKACRTEQERQKLLLNTLYPMYKDQAEQYRENAGSIMKANEANDNLTRAMANLGAVGEPIMTGLKNWIANMIQASVPQLDALISKFGGISSAWDTMIWPLVQSTFKVTLGMDVPPWSEIESQVKSWWSGTAKPALDGLIRHELGIELPDFQQIRNDLIAGIDGLMTPEMKASFSNIGNGLVEAFGTGTQAVNGVLTGAKDFGQWCIENRDTVKGFFEALGANAMGSAEGAVSVIGLMADAIKGLADIGVETVTGALTWTLEHGEAVGLALDAIALGLMAAAVAAHPYAAAIVAAATALGLMKEYGGEDRYDHFFDGYTDAELAKLQEYVEASRAYAQAQKAVQDALDQGEDGIRQSAAAEAAKARLEAIRKTIDDGLIGIYNSWNLGQDGYTDGMYFDVPVRVAEGSREAMQSDVSDMNLTANVKLYPDYSGMGGVTRVLGGRIAAASTTVKWNAEGAVFRRPTIFSTHAGFQGVGEAGPEAVAPIGVLEQYVANAVARQNAGMVTAMQSMLTILSQISENTAGGQQVILDSGAVVGHLAPAMDARLGTIGSRKGRGN